MKQTRHLLDYVATHPNAILSYAKSNMILSIHSNASYHNKPKTQSHTSGHFFLSDDAPNNGAILNTSQIIKSVMSLAVEAELGALYLNACKAVPCQTLLNELGHKQPPTPIQTNNSTALGIVTNNILPCCTKAMDCVFVAPQPQRAGLIPILLVPGPYQPRQLLHKTPLFRPPCQETTRVPYPGLHPQRPTCLHQQVLDHLWQRYHAAATPCRSGSSLKHKNTS
jgi:hypothetical protein